MKKLKEYINDFNIESSFKMTQYIEDNKPILIDSFVEYYGKQHKDQIIDRFNSTYFTFFIGDKLLESIIEECLVKGFNLSEMTEELTDIIVYALEIDGLSDQDKIALANEFPWPLSYVGDTNESVWKISGLYKRLEDIAKKPVAACMTTDLSKTGCFFSIIALPVGLTDTHTLIHEINHAITTTAIKRNCGQKYTQKTGLCVEEKYRTIEELINDKSSFEIEKTFIKKGGEEFPSFDLNNYIRRSKESDSEVKTLVDLFYDEFEEELKEARITNDITVLLDQCGKDNFDILAEASNKIFDTNTNVVLNENYQIDVIMNDMIKNKQRNRK